MTEWDEAAEWFARVVETGATPFNRLASDAVVQLIGDPAGLDILDVGCGEGHIARRLARAGGRVLGVDPTRGLLDRAAAREGDDPLGVEYRLDRAETLTTVPDDAFDVVVASLVLHHVEDLQGALRRCRAALRAAGSIVVIVPHPWSDSPGAKWVDVGDAMRRLLGDYAVEGHWFDGSADKTPQVASVRQIGWYHRTVATWLSQLHSAGFRVQDLEEPMTDETGSSWCGIPRFLALRALAG
ncbi:MAG TPA: class I SAM-dependent methyltransferase [Acidimicrobiales bacterium]|nr:class I SAM-dependent methyltransferase [Acidimicrobiales bacterium]